MTREDILKEILVLKGSNWLLELATGTGKSRMALEKIKSLNGHTLLIVVHRNVHKQNWADEIKKWWKDCSMNIIYTTYVSLPKYAGKYDCAIFDECHHLSNRCLEALESFEIKNSVLCSATVRDKLKLKLSYTFKDLAVYTKDLRAVIEENILPDPQVFLLSLTLNATTPTEIIVKHPKAAKNGIVECSYAQRWNYIRQKNRMVRIHCTERQYLSDLNSQIEYWKKRFMANRSDLAKNKWLRLCGDRLKWLSDKKTPLVKSLLSRLENCRTLTFCNSIAQTEELGKYCINSKNGKSIENYNDFNTGKINHITACNMLNEGR